MIRPRDDVALMAGYHSPQLDVRVRLNTNESPVPPPEAWRRDYARAVEQIDWHRYPDRSAHDLRAAIGKLHGVGPEQVFAANGSNEVLQTLLLTYGGPGRTAAMWEPTYALHAHISRLTGTSVAAGRRAADFSTDLDEVRRVVEADQPSVLFLCSPNNPTGMVDDEATVRAVLELAAAHDALLVVDEAYGQFAPWSALGLVDDGVPLVVTRTFSKTWSMAAARLGYLVGPAEVVSQLERVVLPYHLDAAKQLAGTLALDHVDEMQARVAHLVEERGRLVVGLADLPVQQWPSGANFVLFRPLGASGRGDGAGVWRQLVDRSILVRDCLGPAPPRGVPAGHRRHARRERRLPRRPPGDPDMSPTDAIFPAPRAGAVARTTNETDIAIELLVDGSGRASSATGLPFFDHMLAQLGRHGGFDLDVRATGDLEIDAHHTVEDVGIALGEVLRTALGDKAGVRRFASNRVPLDEALIDVALDLSGRPYLHYEVEFPGEKILGDPPFDPQLVEEFWRAFVTSSAITLHITSVRGRNTHHLIEATFKAVARSLRDAVRIEGTGVPSTKGTL